MNNKLVLIDLQCHINSRGVVIILASVVFLEVILRKIQLLEIARLI